MVLNHTVEAIAPHPSRAPQLTVEPNGRLSQTQHI